MKAIKILMGYVAAILLVWAAIELAL